MENTTVAPWSLYLHTHNRSVGIRRSKFIVPGIVRHVLLFSPETMSDEKHLKATIRISGMTCGSCELLLERKLKGVTGVIDVHVHHRKGIAVITAHADALPSVERIEYVIRKAG